MLEGSMDQESIVITLSIICMPITENHMKIQLLIEWSDQQKQQEKIRVWKFKNFNWR